MNKWIVFARDFHYTLQNLHFSRLIGKSQQHKIWLDNLKLLALPVFIYSAYNISSLCFVKRFAVKSKLCCTLILSAISRRHLAMTALESINISYDRAIVSTRRQERCEIFRARSSKAGIEHHLQEFWHSSDCRSLSLFLLRWCGMMNEFSV